MTGPIRIAIIASGGAARAELTETGLTADKMGKSFITAGKAATGMGSTFEKLAKVGAGLFIAEQVGTYAKEFVGAAANFQSATTLLVTAGGEAQKNLKGVSDGILRLSGETGTSADQLASGMYIVEKAGFRAADGLTVLKNAAEGARAEQVDMATETQAVTSIMTSYHLAAGKSAMVVNELVAASGAAKTTMQQFAGSLATVLPSASRAGLSFAQVGGAIATLTQHGTSAAEATQELASTIRNLQAPNNVASQEMQQLGINALSLSKNLGKRGLTGTLDVVVNAIGKSMGKSGLVMLDTFRKSQSAANDLNLMVKSMPKPLAKLSQGFLDGSVSMKDYQTGFKDMGARGSALGYQFLALVKSADGFNNLLKSGSPASQTFADALKKIMGGAIGMNTALQLSGENMAGFKTRVQEITKAADQGGNSVATWARTQKTFSVEVDRLKFSAEAVGIKLLLPLLPKLAAGFGNVADELDKSHPLLTDFGHGIGAIPGSLKEMAVEAGIAALVLPKLTAGVESATDALTYNVMYLRSAAAAMADTEMRGAAMADLLSGIGAAAKTAAGVGGIVALTQSFQNAGSTMSDFERVAGGALLGFSVQGPWGAAVGGAAAAISILAQNTKRAGADFASTKTDFANLAQTLDQDTGKITANTKAWIENSLAKKGVLQQGLKAGLTQQQLLNAYLGQPAAISRVNAVLDAYQGKLAQVNAEQTALANSGQSFGGRGGPTKAGEQYRQLSLEADSLGLKIKALESIFGDTKGLQAAQRATQLEYAAAHGLAVLLKDGVPKSVVTSISLLGQSKTLADVKSIARQYQLTPKELVTAARITGYDLTLKQARAIERELHAAGNVKIDPHTYISSIQAMNKRAAGLAESGGKQVGVNLTAGMKAGLGGIGAISGIVAGAVDEAIKAGKKAAKSNSPSKRTKELGEDMVAGLTIGISSRAKQPAHAMTKLVRELLKDASGGVGNVDAIFEKYAVSIGKSVKAMDKALASHKVLRKELANDLTAYAKAKTKLDDLVKTENQYAASIKSAIDAGADITQLGSALNPAGIIKALGSQVNKAQQYAALLEQLKGEGLNKTTLQQLLDAGVSGGLATAQALAQGGQSTVDQINKLTKELNSTGAELGKSMGKTMYAAGIQAAQGVINGLLDKKHGIDKVAQELADTLVHSMKKKLKIHSPSQVFAEIGKQSVAGLAIGLDNTVAQRSGSVLAASLVEGFGNPQLSARAIWDAQGGSTPVATVSVQLTAAQQSALARGKSVQMDLDVFHSKGGRKRATGRAA